MKRKRFVEDEDPIDAVQKKNAPCCHEDLDEVAEVKRCCNRCKHEGCLGVLPLEGEGEPCVLDISIPGTMVMNGYTQTGKSHAVRYAFYKYRHCLHHGLLFSNTGRNGNNYDWIPDRFKHHRYGEKLPKGKNSRFKTVGDMALTAFLDEQMAIPQEDRPMGFVIVDDDMSGFHSDVLIRAATQATHHNIWVVICTQHINELDTAIREQVQQVGVFREESENGLKAAYMAYAKADFYKEKDFERMVLDPKLTGGNKFLWRDKAHNKPWRSFKCPKVIPKFMLHYGEEEGEGDKNPRAPKKQRAK